VDRPFQWAFICRRSPSPGERPKTLAATAAGGGKLQLSPTARTEGFLEAANQPQAGVAEPVPQPPATAATARQEPAQQGALRSGPGADRET
jgi:hypothetical protein